MKVPLSLFRSVTESSMLPTLNELLVGLPILALAGPRIALRLSCQTRPQELWIHIQRFLITVAAVSRFDLNLKRPNGHHSGHLQHCQL
jgi:hypothetical protein